MQRARQNTEHELQIISVEHNTRLRVGRPTCMNRTKDVLFSIIYNKYSWNTFTYMTFILLRLLTCHLYEIELNIHEWYNDIIIFIISNNYFFKRLHWNNIGQDYYREKTKFVIVPFFLLSLFIFSLWSHNSPTFYLTHESIKNFNNYDMTLFISSCIYVGILQLVTIIEILRSNKRIRLIRIQMLKYSLLMCYLGLDKLLYLTNTPFERSEENIDNEYHIHHWFCGLVLLFLTEIRQPYYTFVQYIHYSIYLHGIALYSYDSIIE